MIGIPITFDEITPGWLSRAFNAGGLNDAAVADCEVRPFPDGLSATGRLARVSIRYRANQHGPATIIAKMPDPRRRRPSTRRTYQREIRFYQEMGEEVGVRVPRLFFGYASAESDAAIMLLEDMAPAKPGDSTKGCSYEEALAAIRGLAHTQARWWKHPRIVCADWLWSFSLESTPETFASLIVDGWGMLTSDYMEDLPESVLPMKGKADWIYAVVDGLESQPTTLCHPDFRLDNLFFDHGPGGISVAVIDWGRVGRLRGGFAVAMFLAGESGLNGEKIRACLEEYWQVLRADGIDDFSYEECLRDFQLGALAVFGQRLFTFRLGVNTTTPQRILDMRKKSWDRVVRVIDEFQCAEVLGQAL